MKTLKHTDARIVSVKTDEDLICIATFEVRNAENDCKKYGVFWKELTRRGSMEIHMQESEYGVIASFIVPSEAIFRKDFRKIKENKRVKVKNEEMNRDFRIPRTFEKVIEINDHNIHSSWKMKILITIER